MYIKLVQNREFLKLFIIQFLVYFGSWFSAVAIYTLLIKFKLDPIKIALVTSMFSLPALLGFINGAIVDKVQLKRFMSLTLFAEIVFTSLFLLVQDKSWIYALAFFVFLRTLCSFLFFAAQMALFPQLLKDKELLQKANELHSVIWSVTFALGMSLGGLFVNSFGVYAAIKVDIVFYVVAFLLFLSLDFEVKKGSSKSIKKLVIEGYFYLKREKKILFFIFLHSVVAFTAFDTIINLLTDVYYKELISISLAIGFMHGVRAFGLMVGPFVLGKIINKKNLYIFFGLEGMMIVLWGFFAKNFYISLVLMFFVGFFTTTLWSYTYTLVQTATKKEFLGRVLAYNDMIFTIITVMISFLSGYLYEKGVSLNAIIFFLGSVFLIASFFVKNKNF